MPLPKLSQSLFEIKKMVNPISEDIQSVKLISSDDSVFVVERKVALASGTIKNMLSSPGKQLN
jgi:hypothetical protein